MVLTARAVLALMVPPWVQGRARQNVHGVWSPCHHPSGTSTSPRVVPGAAGHAGGTGTQLHPRL